MGLFDNFRRMWSGHKQQVRKPRQRAVLHLEQLETRFAPATLVNPTTVTYQDLDGDNVLVKFSRPILNQSNLQTVLDFSPDPFGSGRETLRAINLSGVAGAARTSITTKATPSKADGGDGFALLNTINAAGVDLGNVTVDGSLYQITAGDANTATPGLAGLTVQSTGSAIGHSVIQGKLGYLNVKTDVRGFVEVQGDIGRATIGGSLLGSLFNNSGRISSTGRMGAVKIGGDVVGGSGVFSGRINSYSAANLTIGGSLFGGGGLGSGAIITTGGMGFGLGSLKIAGDIVGGDGVFSGYIGAYDGGSIARATIGGSLIGGTGTFSGRIYCEMDLGSIKILGDIQGGSKSGTAGSGHITARRISTVTIGGSLIAGGDNTAGLFQHNGAITATYDIGSATIGNLIGNSTNPVLIYAGGAARPSPTSDVAIGKLTIKGRVERALILAGNGGNADAQIGTVIVGGDWIASSIVAGVSAGTSGFFGDVDDHKIRGDDIKDDSLVFSQIKSLTIKGQAFGAVGTSDVFGIVAEHVASVSIGGRKVSLTPGRSNDRLVDVAIASYLRINEV